MASIDHTAGGINAMDPAALTRLLDLEELTVTALELQPHRHQLNVHCTPTAPVAACPRCQHPSAQVHQYHLRTIRDLPWGPWTCYLHLLRRRFWCAGCARPFTEALAALAPWARSTRRFATAVVAAVPTATIQAVATAWALGYKAVEGLFYRTAHAQHPSGPPAHPVRRLGIDEIAARKGHGHFHLVLVDLDTGRVLEQLPDRDRATLRRYLLSWSAAARAAVEEVAVDFWAAYHEVAAEVLPQARVVGDRFHVQKHLNEAVQQTRRAVQATLPAADAAFVRRHRHVLVSNEDDLDAAAWCNLTVLKVGVPELERVHTLKEQFRAIFQQAPDRPSAAARLQGWLTAAQQSGVVALAEFAAFVRRWREPILNYFVARTSSGRVEGLNNKIKLIKRQAFGFGNDAHFRLRVLMACAGTP